MLTAAKVAEERGWKVWDTKTEWYHEEIAKKGMKVLKPSPALEAGFKKIGEQLTVDWLKRAGAEGQAVVDAYEDVRLARRGQLSCPAKAGHPVNAELRIRMPGLRRVLTARGHALANAGGPRAKQLRPRRPGGNSGPADEFPSRFNRQDRQWRTLWRFAALCVKARSTGN